MQLTMHDQAKLTEYLRDHEIFSKQRTSRYITVEQLQRLFTDILEEKYYFNELIKIVFDATGISRTKVRVKDGSGQIYYAWCLHEDFPYTPDNTTDR